MSNLLDIRNVDLGYEPENLIIKNININISEKDFIIINGPNGSGKSSFLKLLYMRLLPYRGSFSFFGKEINNISKKDIIDIRKKIGVILQDNYLIPYFSVSQNIELALQVQEKKNINIKNRVHEIANWVGLGKLLMNKVNNLSEGEKQKLVIARSLVCKPKLLIADEPMNHLDNQTRKKLFFLLSSINQLGTTIILVDKNSDRLDDKNQRYFEISNQEIVEVKR